MKQKLRPLATSDAGEDPDDELKGLGLEALWPDLIGPNELFSIITPPNEHFMGNYTTFLYHEIVPDIQPSDLPVALKWIESQQIEDDLSYFSHLADEIMLKAMNYLDYPGIVDGLARAMISRFKNDEEQITSFIRDSEFKEALIKDDTKRRLLLSALVPLFDNIQDLYVLTYYNPAVITNNDFGWVIEQVQNSKYIDHQQRWARLANHIIDLNEVDQISLIQSVYHANPGIRVEFSPRISPIALISPEANKMRQHHLKMQELLEKRDEKKKLLDPPPATRIANLLARCESGDYEAWWQLSLDLTLEPDSKRYGNELEPDLTSLPGWSEANVLTRDRIIQAALKYISSRDPEIKQWLGTNTIYRPASAGYKAFWLLLKERPHIFSSISHDTWVKWAPVIIAYPSHLRNISAKDMRKVLIAEAYRQAPKSFIDALIILIDKDNLELGHIFIIRDVNDIWDERFHEALLPKAKDEKLKLESTGDLLNILLAHDSNEARKYAESLFLSLYPEETARQKVIIIGGLLLAHPSDSSWIIIWPIIENNIEIGKDIILNAGRKSYGQSQIIAKSLKEAYLAKLFIWLYRNFPPSEYSLPLGGFTDTPRYQIAEFRDSIIRHLKERGTLAAVEAIAEIAREFLQEDWFKWMIPEAQEIFLRQSWVAYSQSYVRDFIINYEKNQSPIDDKEKERRDEIIQRLKSIEFGISRLSLSSGNARQNLVELQVELDLIKNDIKSKDKSVEELRVDLGDISSTIKEELERTKLALIVALEEHIKSHQDLEDTVSDLGAVFKDSSNLKQGTFWPLWPMSLHLLDYPSAYLVH